MQFQQIRGATVKLMYGGCTFLIDPFFAPKDFYPPLEVCHFPDKRWPTADLPLDGEKIVQDVDAVIVTHMHPDHFDEFAAKVLAKNIPLFVQDETDAEMIKAFGFSDVRRLSYDGVRFNDVTLFRVDCLHGHPETTQKYYDATHLRATASGVVFENKDEKTFYLAGDTIWFDNVEKTLKKYHPEIIALNAADAQFTDSGSIIMGLEDMRQVCLAAPEAKVIITHLDAVPHAMIGRHEVKDFVSKHHLDAQVIVPDDGEIVSL